MLPFPENYSSLKVSWQLNDNVLDVEFKKVGLPCSDSAILILKPVYAISAIPRIFKNC